MSAGDEPSTGRSRAPARDRTTPTCTNRRPAPISRRFTTAPSFAAIRRFSTGSAPALKTLSGQTRFQTLLTVGSRIYYETHYAPLLQMQGFVNEIALDVRRTDGAVRPIVASARQLRGSGGVPAINRVALFDSTDRRRYEQELLQARRRAEEGGERTGTG